MTKRKEPRGGEPRVARRTGRPARQAFAVDDDPATLALLCDVVRDAGWKVKGYSDVASTRQALSDARPGVVILDDELPDGRGGDLARELHEDPRMRDVAVLVCTAAHPVRREEIARWAAVLTKPFTVGELERFLQLASRRRQRSGGCQPAG